MWKCRRLPTALANLPALARRGIRPVGQVRPGRAGALVYLDLGGAETVTSHSHSGALNGGLAIQNTGNVTTLRGQEVLSFSGIIIPPGN